MKFLVAHLDRLGASGEVTLRDLVYIQKYYRQFRVASSRSTLRSEAACAESKKAGSTSIHKTN